MGEVTITPIKTRREMNDFIQLPHRLYAHCPQYVPDLDSDIRETFDPRKNVGLEYSDIQPFVAYNGQGVCVGRIAGIINHRANEKWKTRNVRFGLIEFIDNPDISEALLKAVEAWGRERGMTHIQGPMGIFDFDKEGMLVEDFDQMGSMITIYNPFYYPRHLEALGYRKEVDWVQVRIDVPQDVPAKYARVARLTKEMFGLKVKKLTNEDVYKRGYGRKVFELLNLAYSPLFGYTELTDKQIDSFLKRYLPLIDRRMLPVIEDEEGRIVGVTITMGSLSHALRQSHGRLLPLGWFHLLRALKWKHEDKAEMLLVAVHPDYQGLGVNALFFDDLIPVYNELGYRWAETGPQLESNVRELSQWKPLNPTFTKRRRCYTREL
ncbi:N-acetyltransferase [Parabacteroides distasonis]|uniref:N-acetyltransferase n=2 Tax=Parabacteroides distasonis TaxID=823 RepID=UPI00232DDB23|nr:N-acetyltransferase [Parabacteroides distasonis]MDB9029203.1 N-acetyltransferase [Parabacteroides distasonis]MDB9075004.1 N-acetyltransferase [Parabacteroides distasonis]